MFNSGVLWKRTTATLTKLRQAGRRGRRGSADQCVLTYETLEQRHMLAGTITGIIEYVYRDAFVKVNDLEVRAVRRHITSDGDLIGEVKTWSGADGSFTININSQSTEHITLFVGPGHSSGTFKFDSFENTIDEDSIQIATFTLGSGNSSYHVFHRELNADLAHRLYVFDAASMMYDFYQQHLRGNSTLTTKTLTNVNIDLPDSVNQFRNGMAGGVQVYDPWIDLKGHNTDETETSTWTTVGEEYSHYLQFKNDIPSETGSHSPNKNLRHEHGFAKGARLAFSEGFALFLATVAQERMGYDQIGFSKGGADSLELPFALGDGIAKHPGEDNELAVAATLWDLYDAAPNETTEIVGFKDNDTGVQFNADETQLEYDGLTGLDAIWELAVDKQPASFQQFWSAIIDSENSPKKRIEYGAILQTTRIAAAPTDSQIPFPTFRFQVPKTSGGAPSLNRFALHVVNKTSDETVWRHEFNLNDDIVDPIKDEGKYTEYEVDLEDKLISILPSTTNECGCEKDEFVWLIESGYEPDDGSASATPLYWSDALPLDLYAYWTHDSFNGDTLGNHHGRVSFTDAVFETDGIIAGALRFWGPRKDGNRGHRRD